MACIVVVGSYNADLAIDIKRFPAPGETVLGEALRMSPGGKGSNQAIAAARLGAPVYFIGRIGNDSFGQEALTRLKREGVDPSYVVVDRETPTGVALILVESSGENEIVVAPGANKNLAVEDIERARKLFCRETVLLAQLEVPIPVVARAAEIAVHEDCFTILNPAPATPAVIGLLPLFDLITPNETEAGVMAQVEVNGLETAELAAGRLLDLGARGVAITLGARGCLYVSRTRKIFIPPFTVPVYDTTGAGDAFNGALAYALTNGQPLEDALRFANAAGALSVTRPGAADSMPSLKEVELFLKTRGWSDST